MCAWGERWRCGSNYDAKRGTRLVVTVVVVVVANHLAIVRAAGVAHAGLTGESHRQRRV